MSVLRGYITLAKARIADEIGFDEDDLASLYGIQRAALDDHLAELEVEPLMIWQRVLADVDALRMGYRRRAVSDEHILQLLNVIRPYEFGALVETLATTGRIGWQMNAEDAAWVAARAAEVFGLDADEQAQLCRYLQRMIAWPNLTSPANTAEWQRRVVDMATYLVELTGIV